MNRTSLTLALALLALSACAAPVATPAAPAPSIALPTPTAAQRAAPTSAPPTPTPTAKQAISAALRASGALETYRIRFTVNLQITPDDSAVQDQIFIDFIGSFRDADVAFEQRDPSTANPDAGIADGTLRVVTVGGQTYAFGPLPVAGASSAAWYALGAGAPSATQPMFDSQTTLDLLFKKIDLAQIQPDGQDTIDGAPCTRYQGGEHVALRFVDSLGTPTTPEMIEREKLPVEQRLREDGISYQDSDARLWVCDGLLRRIEAALTLIPSGAPQTVSYALLLEITEPNGAVKINAPAGALQLGETAASDALTAVVYNGGNVREQPNLSGRVLDQINARETVLLLAQTSDGRWFRITNPRGITGWVSVTLLTIEPAVAQAVPVE